MWLVVDFVVVIVEVWYYGVLVVCVCGGYYCECVV